MMNRLSVAALTVVAITVAGCGGVVKANHGGNSGSGNGPSDTSPTISSVSPNSGPVSGGTSVTITGTKFVSGARVFFASLQAQTVTVTSETEIRTLTPRAVAGGGVDVTVRNPDGQSGASRLGFLYTTGTGSPAPTITSITPTSGFTDGGTSVQFTGSNFLTGALVFFGTVTAPTVTVDGTTQIHAIAPVHGEGTVDVTVRNSDGQSAVLAHAFNYTPADPPPDPPPAGNDSLLAGKTPANYTLPPGWSSLVADGFETGDFAKWSWICCNGGGPSSISINSNPAFAHTGSYSSDMYFRIPTSQPGGIDSDMRVGYGSGLGSFSLTHIYVSGYVYFRNTGSDSSRSDIGRKLLYIKSLKPDGGQAYEMVVSARSYAGDTSVGGLEVYVVPNDAGGGAFIDYVNRGLQFNRWYQLEFDLQESTPGAADGFYKVYLDGQQIGSHSGIMTRASQWPQGINQIEVGNQAWRDGTPGGSPNNVDEHRYWDDIIILKK